MSKHDVLVVERRQIEHLLGQLSFRTSAPEVTDLVSAAETSAFFVDRRLAESSTTLIQFVGYALVKHADRYLSLKRSEESSSDRIKSKRALLFGGHVDRQDGSGIGAVRDCVARELDEELGIRPRIGQIIGFTVDPMSDVGRRHLGVIYESETQTDSVTLGAGMDLNEFAIPATCTVDLMERSLLLATPASEFDTWSQLVLDSDVFQNQATLL